MPGGRQLRDADGRALVNGAIARIRGLPFPIGCDARCDVGVRNDRADALMAVERRYGHEEPATLVWTVTRIFQCKFLRLAIKHRFDAQKSALRQRVLRRSLAADSEVIGADGDAGIAFGALTVAESGPGPIDHDNGAARVQDRDMSGKSFEALTIDGVVDAKHVRAPGSTEEGRRPATFLRCCLERGYGLQNEDRIQQEVNLELNFRSKK